jgi:disulfide bond formation protein DsbB
LFKKYFQISENKGFWLGLLALGVSFETIALFYQYYLDYPPCVLCIHARIWVLGMIIVSLLALFIYKNWIGLFTMQVLMTLLSAGLFERSYQLLGIERGFIFGSCSMESGLPTWFALDDWFPSVFKVWEPCGYTPELLFGVTLAEALIVVSSILLLLSSVLTLSLIVNRFSNNKSH